VSPACTTAKIPHSYVYRYVPKTPGDLANGKLQVLQVFNASNQLITEASQTPLTSPDQVALHTYGDVFDKKWKTIHDTAVDGTAPFNANSLSSGVGTPFKRPENGLFQPDSHFKADNGGFPASPGGKNDGDNEITGIHVSDGDPDTNGILGARNPNAFHGGWRVFYTQQHGDNSTYEVTEPK
jgi:hypothetical protein